MGNVIIPTDFHSIIFQRDSNHQPDINNYTPYLLFFSPYYPINNINIPYIIPYFLGLSTFLLMHLDIPFPMKNTQSSRISSRSLSASPPTIFTSDQLPEHVTKQLLSSY